MKNLKNGLLKTKIPVKKKLNINLKNNN